MKKEPQIVTFKGHELKCPICSTNLFRTRKVLLNTEIKTFFSLDFTDPSAFCFICSNCNYILWFLK